MSSGDKGPAPQVVWKYPFNDALGMEATGVPPQTSIRVQFDRFLAPDSAVRQAICVQAADPTQKNAPCVGNLSPEYDPVDRVAVWKGASLLPNQRYNVRLLVPSSDDDPTGVRAFDGVPLDKEYTFAFTTGSGPNPGFVEPDRTTNSGFCATSQCLVPTTGCVPTQGNVQGPRDYLVGSLGACTACHTTTYARANVFPLIPAGTTPAAVPVAVSGVIQKLVMQATVATETATGPDPTVPRRSTKDVFAQNMPYIDAHNPGNSFLLYKVLLGMTPRCGHLNEESANPQLSDMVGCGVVNASADTYACSSIGCAPDGGAMIVGDAGPVATMDQMAPPLVSSWVPPAQWKPPVAGEYNRLRLRIRGDSMPQGQPVAYQNVLGLSAWIAAGASTTCP